MGSHLLENYLILNNSNISFSKFILDQRSYEINNFLKQSDISCRELLNKYTLENNFYKRFDLKASGCNL